MLSTPRSAKARARTALENLETSGSHEHLLSLYELCLFSKNRVAIEELDVFPTLVSAIKSSDSVSVEYGARVLQLFAQDGDNFVKTLSRMDVPSICLSVIQTTGDSAKCALAGLIFWLAQDPACKKRLIGYDAKRVLKEVGAMTSDAALAKFIVHGVRALETDVKSCAEMREKILGDEQDGTADSEKPKEAKVEDEQEGTDQPTEEKNEDEPKEEFDGDAHGDEEEKKVSEEAPKIDDVAESSPLEETSSDEPSIEQPPSDVPAEKSDDVKSSADDKEETVVEHQADEKKEETVVEHQADEKKEETVVEHQADEKKEEPESNENAVDL